MEVEVEDLTLLADVHEGVVMGILRDRHTTATPNIPTAFPFQIHLTPLNLSSQVHEGRHLHLHWILCTRVRQSLQVPRRQHARHAPHIRQQVNA